MTMSTATPARPTTSSWMIPMLVLMVSSFMAVLDSSIVNAAIPTMQKYLGASPDDIEWVGTGYTLTLGVIVPISNWLGGRIGASLAHRLCVVGFALASALCGLAWNLDSMITFRVIQAIPGGILPVMTLTILYKIVPKEKMGTAMGIYGLGVVVAPALGPPLGGYVVEYLDWRLIFYINVPIGILAAFAAYFLIPVLPRVRTYPFDFWGFVSIGYGLFALLLATSKGQKWGWTSYPVLILVVSGLLALALFAVIENEVDHPLLNLRALRHWSFVNSLVIMGVLSVGLFATAFYLPQFLQNGQDRTAFNSGLLLLPQALTMALLMPLAGRIYDRFGPRWPAFIGLTIAALGTYLLTGINIDMTRTEVRIWTIIWGMGIGLAMMPIVTAGLSSLPSEDAGSGSALNNIVQRVSSSIGLAGLGALVARTQAQLASDQSSLVRSGSNLPQLTALRQHGPTGLYALYQQVQLHALAGAYSAVFLVATALTIACVPLALWLRRPAPVPQPAPSLRPAHAATAAPAPRPLTAAPAPTLAGAGR